MTTDRRPKELQAELLRLADALIAEIRVAREESAQLLEILDQAVMTAPADVAEASAPAPPAVGNADTVRPMVLEMARTGHSRAEVETYIDEAFGLKVPTDLLDAVFSAQPPARGSRGR